MRVRVSNLECAGHGRCNLVNPELFPLDDDGFSAVDEQEVPPGQEDDARQGAMNCPAQAIEILGP